MQIVIPMSGVGKRFLEAGYTEPKPLIAVDGKPMIEHVVNLFPGESNFIFVCNNDHLGETPMRSVLERIAPGARIVGIAPHKKGPVHAVAQVFDLIGDDEETIVNYCDFSKFWDYGEFLRSVRESAADGAISAYRGFHPHMLGTTNYAFMRNDGNWMLEIKEKEPFTDNRMNEYASDGTYYFRQGRILKKYFRELMARDLHLNGEYYVSLVFNLLKEDGLRVRIHEIEHMLQWGTPQDLEEYQGWSDYFRHLGDAPQNLPARKNSINLIPLAGRGQRFADAGYDRPKPLIEIDGEPMIVRAAGSLPPAERNIFVCLGEHLGAYPLETEIRRQYPDAKIVRLDRVTEGQACTCEIGLAGEDPEAQLLIGACDNGMTWDREAYRALMDDETADAVVWSFRRHPSGRRNPAMYGWLEVNDRQEVLSASVKKPISDDPYNDHAIVGTFFFRKARHFSEGLRRLYEGNIRVNNEFYVDSIVNELIAMGLKVKVFEVEHYICWGTPNDLLTYQYWQRFFGKCPWVGRLLNHGKRMLK